MSFNNNNLSVGIIAKIIKDYKRSFIFPLALVMFAVMGCAAIDDSDWESTDDGIGSSIISNLGAHDSVAAGHMMGDMPAEEPKMNPGDKEYLDDKCSGCHDLNRVFWTKAPRSIWNNILNEKQHLELELKPYEKERLHRIFQKYLSKNK